VQKEFPNAFRQRAAIAETFADEIGGSLAEFALRFPLYSTNVSSMITGLNSEAQVMAAINTLDGVRPRPDIFNKAYDLWKSGFNLT
jgi:aryl-alcohol dehydrogenase-like predicted oxidoreductase